MSFMTPEQIAAARATSVRSATLVELQFVSRTMRVWNGAGKTTVAGLDWDGLGGIGGIDGLQQTREPVSTRVKLKLAGVDQGVLESAKRGQADVEGRPVDIWEQLYDGDWQPLGPRIPLFRGIMQRLGIVRDGGKDTTGGTRIVELEVENAFAGRSRPSAGRWTDADQQSRHPGDKLCRFVPLQRALVISWPNY